jgi:hypothetical protein
MFLDTFEMQMVEDFCQQFCPPCSRPPVGPPAPSPGDDTWGECPHDFQCPDNSWATDTYMDFIAGTPGCRSRANITIEEALALKAVPDACFVTDSSNVLATRGPRACTRDLFEDISQQDPNALVRIFEFPGLRENELVTLGARYRAACGSKPAVE